MYKLALRLAEKLIGDVYNPAYSSAHSFTIKLHRTILGMLVAEDECYWVSNFHNKITLVYVSLVDSYDMLVHWLGNENNKETEWIYGNLHQLEVNHPLSTRLGPKPFNRGPYRCEGGMHTLLMIRPKYTAPENNPFNCQRSGVPVWRQLIDVSNWDNCKCILPMGTSGEVASPYYDNMMSLFIDKQYIPMLWSKGEVEKYKEHELICDPTKPVDAERKCILM